MRRDRRPPAPMFFVIGRKPWNRRVFQERIHTYPGTWRFFTDLKKLTPAFLEKAAPRYIFFLHWSEKVPEFIINGYECIGFHMTDLPFGRGGSPLQNLILRGIRETQLSCFRMTKDLDAGPVYLKKPLCLSGGAEEIYMRADLLAAGMIREIVEGGPEPVPQSGEVVVFPRRRPEESEIPACTSLDILYDFLRMLDAEGYPRAFLVYRGFHYEFSRSTRFDGKIVAEVTITREEGS